MKRLLSILTRAVLLSSVASVLVHAQTKFGIVDMKRAFETYYKTKQAEAQIKDRATDSDKVYKGMIEDYRKANDDYKKLVEQSNDQALAGDERDKRKKSAETKLMELQEIEKSVRQFENQAKISLGEMEKRMREKREDRRRDSRSSEQTRQRRRLQRGVRCRGGDRLPNPDHSLQQR
jgi:outer membrane protein